MSATPGPWQAVLNDIDQWTVRTGEEQSRPVASMWLNGDDQKANALIAAAAPDMLAELKHIDAHGYVTGADFDRVRALIAKAEGAS